MATDERTKQGRSEPAELPQTKAEVQARREELRKALVDLEDVLSAPAGDHARWGEEVALAIERMHTTLQHHVRETEAEDGMLAQLEEDAAWLVGRVEQLRREHDQLLEMAAALTTQCREATSTDEIAEVREGALELLQGVSRHRQRGTDLLFDAYMVDITAAD